MEKMRPAAANDGCILCIVEGKISTYYSRIILNSFSNPFSKLCQHNPSRPNPGPLRGMYYISLRWITYNYIWRAMQVFTQISWLGWASVQNMIQYICVFTVLGVLLYIYILHFNNFL